MSSADFREDIQNCSIVPRRNVLPPATTSFGSRVYFGKKKATVNSATTSRLKVTIPSRVKKGTVDVYVLVDGQKSNVVKFQVK